MAMPKLTGAHLRIDHDRLTAPTPADVAARATASHLRPTAPLPQVIVDAMHRIEARLAVLPDGESMVINGVTVTAVSAPVADLLTWHARLQSRCRRLSERASTTEDYNQLWDWQTVLADCRCQLAAAGRLDLVGGDV